MTVTDQKVTFCMLLARVLENSIQEKRGSFKFLVSQQFSVDAETISRLWRDSFGNRETHLSNDNEERVEEANNGTDSNNNEDIDLHQLNFNSLPDEVFAYGWKRNSGRKQQYT